VLYFDGVGAVIKILDFLKTNNLSLSELADEIPSFFVVKKEVNCAFQDKGRVIRRIIESTKGDRVVTIDGVKINDENGFVLILPDLVKPVCRIIGESSNEEYASELAEIYSEKIKEITDR